MTSLVDHLKDDAEQLDRQAENAKLTGGETYVRVKDPSILSSDLKRAANEIERLRSELSTARRTALLEARRQAFDEAGLKAREYAAHYPEASDGRNTFIIFAEWAEGRP